MKISQEKRTLELLKQGDLKSEDAIYKYGMPRISSRIHELKRKGHNIQGFFVTVNGKSKYYYRLCIDNVNA